MPRALTLASVRNFTRTRVRTTRKIEKGRGVLPVFRGFCIPKGTAVDFAVSQYTVDNSRRGLNVAVNYISIAGSSPLRIDMKEPVHFVVEFVVVDVVGLVLADTSVDSTRRRECARRTA